jgi:hypothetical protein
MYLLLYSLGVVHTAMQTALVSDQTLSQCFASFSFVTVSISSQGARLAAVTVAEKSLKFAFSLFSLLAAMGFLCGLMATVLAEILKRQLSLTQTKEDHTAHEFAGKFGLYIRFIGGLTSFGGIFFATAIFHFMHSIYRVRWYIVGMLQLLWLVGGTVIGEIFISEFGQWTLEEVMEDLGEVVNSPTMQLSQSPIIGSLKIAQEFVARTIFKSRRRESETKTT